MAPLIFSLHSAVVNYIEMNVTSHAKPLVNDFKYLVKFPLFFIAQYIKQKTKILPSFSQNPAALMQLFFLSVLDTECH